MIQRLRPCERRVETVSSSETFHGADLQGVVIGIIAIADQIDGAVNTEFLVERPPAQKIAGSRGAAL